MRTPDLTIEGMPNWKAFCVYAWKRNEKYLYVGVTSNGYRRPFYHHDVIDRIDAVVDGDLFEFWFYKSRQRANEVEAEMIRTHLPVYNRAIPTGSYGRIVYRKRNCLKCAAVLPKGYARGLCGKCEKVRILATANRLAREAMEQWERLRPKMRWREGWDYDCEERKCSVCGDKFMQRKWWEAFCSSICERKFTANVTNRDSTPAPTAHQILAQRGSADVV